MHFLNALLGLTGAASVLDIYFHDGTNCDGSSALFRNVNPGICCVVPGITRRSVAFRGIVPSWSITCRSYQGNGCEVLCAQTSVRGVNYQCHSFQNNYNYNSAWYSFNNRKRGEGEATCAAQAGEEPTACEGTQTPDELILKDGTHYRVADLEADPLEHLYVKSFVLAANGTTAADLPEEFKQLEIQE